MPPAHPPLTRTIRGKQLERQLLQGCIGNRQQHVPKRATTLLPQGTVNRQGQLWNCCFIGTPDRIRRRTRDQPILRCNRRPPPGTFRGHHSVVQPRGTESRESLVARKRLDRLAQATTNPHRIAVMDGLKRIRRQCFHLSTKLHNQSCT